MIENLVSIKTKFVPKKYTAWKVSKYGVISGPYFPVFEPEIIPYLGTFHAVIAKTFQGLL